jgi:hypothetical protein
MASFRLKRFCDVAVLKNIDFRLLSLFLQPHKDYLTGCGLQWADEASEFDYDGLARILMSPTVDAPEDMLDALYFVDNLSDAETFDRILGEAIEAGLEVSNPDISPQDLTIIVWMKKPEILERVHAEHFSVKQRKYVSYFCAEAEIPDMPPITEPIQAALEFDLNESYETKKKGRGTKVFPFVRENGVWFLVRHGQRINREGTIEANGEPGSIFYRPEKFDVLIYYPLRGELSMHTATLGERKAYCQYFGKHLFGREDFFCFDSPIAKYTLEPLIYDGRGALVCSDIDGIEGIRLVELQIQHESGQKDLEIRRANDVFLALENQERSLQDEMDSTDLIKAKFKVMFRGADKERTVEVGPPNTASYDHDVDGELVNEWLLKRGFILVTNTEDPMDEPESVLTTS